MAETIPSKPTILLVRFSSIGDIVLTTAAMAYLKQELPGVRLVLVTKKSFAPLFREHPFLDDVVEFQGFNSGFWRSIAENNPSAILDLHSNIRSLRIKNRYWNLPSFSYNKRGLERWMLIKKWRVKPLDSVVERYLSAVNRLLMSPWGKRLSSLNVEHVGTAHSGTTVNRQYNNLQLPGLSLGDFSSQHWKSVNHSVGESEVLDFELLPKRYGVLHISATYNTKRISFRIWEHIIRNQQEPLVITGGKADMEHAAALMAIANGGLKSLFPLINKVGQTDLQQTACLIKNAGWYVGGDTGFTHVAACYGIPHLVIWGNTSPDLGFVPWLGDAYSLEIQQHMKVEGLACNPCSKLGYAACPQGHFSCMNLQNLQELESKLQFLRDRIH